MARGAYVLSDCEGTPDVILMGSGSEVQHALAAQVLLADQGVAARVVSVPCMEWFGQQDEEYRESVLPAAVRARVSVEAGIAMPWRSWVGDAGRSVSIEHFGASGDGQALFDAYGIDAPHVVSAAHESLDAVRA